MITDPDPKDSDLTDEEIKILLIEGGDDM